jgi:hypothetical protein
MAVRLSALRTGRSLPSGRFLVLISVRDWVDPRVIVQLEGLGKLKKSNNLIGNRTHDLVAFSVVPQPTALLHAWYNDRLMMHWKEFGRKRSCLLRGIFPEIACKDWGKPTNTTIRAAVTPGDIRIEHVLNIGLIVTKGRQSLHLIDILSFPSVSTHRRTESCHESQMDSTRNGSLFSQKLICWKYGGWEGSLSWHQHLSFGTDAGFHRWRFGSCCKVSQKNNLAVHRLENLKSIFFY